MTRTDPPETPYHNGKVTLDAIREAYDAMDKLKATYVVPAELAAQAQAIVDQRMLGGLVTVVPSEVTPKDRIYVIDEAKFKKYLEGTTVEYGFSFDYNEFRAKFKFRYTPNLDIG